MRPEKEMQSPVPDVLSSRRLPDLGIKSTGRMNEAREAGLEEEHRQYTNSDILISGGLLV